MEQGQETERLCDINPMVNPTMNRNSRDAWHVVVIPLFLTYSACVSWAQTPQGAVLPATQLIGRLTHYADHEQDPFNATGFTCGSLGTEKQQNRALAASLSRLGSSAAPDIERALDSVENRGLRSEFAPGAGWLMYAYARIMGPAAYGRLSRMIGNPELRSLQNTLAASIALSLNLTSYVDRLVVPTGILCRTPQPRDTLDQFILAWERKDRKNLEFALGARAKAALARLPDATTHSDKGSRSVAIGYRLGIAGRWSEPPETLEDSDTTGGIPGNPENMDINVNFKDAVGRDCGRYVVRFKRAAYRPPEIGYLIDNPDIPGLLRVLASCAIRDR
jgi:hypothetical protein